MREEVQEYVFNRGFNSIYSSCSPNEQRKAIFQTGSHPYQLGFISVRISRHSALHYVITVIRLSVLVKCVYTDDLSPSENCTGAV